MKYVFFGSPRFAAIILEQLIDADMSPVAIVCNPDRPFGRKQIITPPPTKVLVTARDPAIAILQPENPVEAVETLNVLGADLFVVAAYARIIPESILAVPRVGTLGVHPSLLPKYRGATPIQSAILAGETETGVTIYLMDAGMDHGPIVASGTCPIAANENYPTLEKELAGLGAHLLITSLPGFSAGKTLTTVQDETKASYTKKFKTENAFVDNVDLTAAENGDPEKATTILRKINAFNPEPGAWTMRDGVRIKMLGATIENGRLKLLETRK